MLLTALCDRTQIVGDLHIERPLDGAVNEPLPQPPVTNDVRPHRLGWPIDSDRLHGSAHSCTAHWSRLCTGCPPWWTGKVTSRRRAHTAVRRFRYPTGARLTRF